MAAADNAATAAEAPASAKKQKRSEKAQKAGGSAKKPRSAAPAKTQSNTLDSWFKKGAAPKTAPEAASMKSSTKDSAGSKLASVDGDAATATATTANDMGNTSSNSGGVTAATETAMERSSVTPPAEPKKKKKTTGDSGAKKLVQRRIHINDPCRVCEAARTEESSRCELRCLGCDMTVHKKCYGVETEDPIDDWQCRRCQFVLDKKKELLQGGEHVGDEAMTVATASTLTETASLLPPVHKPLESSHKHHALHCESDFATVFQFLKRFRRMGLKTSMDATIKNLADALIEPTPNKFLEELHLRLLLNVEATISKNHDWTVSLARFLADAKLDARSASLGAFITSGAPSSKTVATTAGLYAALSASERVAILKHLCEAQFDDNDTLVERIGDQEGDSLRDEPAGTDSSGRSYWALEDAPSVLDGTVWVCRSAAPNEEQANGVWETVSDDLASLESLVEWLSLSSETADLQLWQRFSSGILKSLERRTKKQQQSAARLARMPHLLGGVSGLALGSLVDDDGFGVRRSTRNRRAVKYHVESDGEPEEEDEDEEEEEEEENASSASDEEGSDDEEGEGSDANRPSKRSQAQQAGQKVHAEPSRRSARLRGADSSFAAPASPLQLSSSSSSRSPSRGRRGRRVATRPSSGRYPGRSTASDTSEDSDGSSRSRSRSRSGSEQPEDDGE